MGSSSSLLLVGLTGCVQGCTLSEPIPLSPWSEWQCWVSSGVSRCAPSSAAPHSVSSTARGAENPGDKHIHMGQVGEYMGIKREKKATAQSLQDYFSQRNYLTLKECKT